MDLYQVNGLKKISVSYVLDCYEDDEVICPYCDEFVDITKENLGEFTNKEKYKSLECNYCNRIFAVKYYSE